jgi:hypothetical protein
MKKLILTAAAIAALSTATVMSSPANAYCRGCGVGAGLIGGLAAGAIIGSAVANSRPAPVYEAEPVYEARPVCHWARSEPYWDGYGWVRRRVRVCN